MRRHALVAATLVLVAGCSMTPGTAAGGGGETATATGTTATGTTATADTGASGDTAAPSLPGDETDGGDDSSSTTSSTEIPTDDTGEAPPTDGPIVTSTRGVKQELHQKNFFKSEGWDERNTQVPLVGPVFGLVQQLGEDVSECPSEGSSDFPLTTSPLELRLNGQAGTLSVTVGQTTNSTNSDVLLDAKLVVDGTPRKTATLKYNETKTLTTPVDGVSVVQLLVSVDATSEQCATEPVAYNAFLTGG